VRILFAPEMVTLSDEVMPADERVPVAVKLVPLMSPMTSNFFAGSVVPMPTYPAGRAPSPPEMKNTLVLSSWKSTRGWLPVWFATMAGPVPALVMMSRLVPVLVVVILTTPPETVRFPVIVASSLTSKTGV